MVSGTEPPSEADGQRDAPLPAALEGLRPIIERAVARSCPGTMASLREDIVQSALLRLLERSRRDERFTPRSSSYLWELAYCVTVDELRRVSRRRENPTELQKLGSLPDRGTPSPEHLASAGELGRAIRGCIALLARPRRWSVLLHLHGFDVAEAAGVLGWGLHRVRNLTYRGLADLRACLRTKGIEP